MLGQNVTVCRTILYKAVIDHPVQNNVIGHPVQTTVSFQTANICSELKVQLVNVSDRVCYYHKCDCCLCDETKWLLKGVNE